jgi:release factor glutamine methyltransferase
MKPRLARSKAVTEKPEPATTRIEAIAKVSDFLSESGIDAASDDARLLLLGVTGISALELAMTPRAPLSEEEAQLLTECAYRRAEREPVSRIIGERGFWSLDIVVAPDVLDPRPDTETLVETTLALLGDRRDERLRILDLGTGSGAILCALLSELPNAYGVAVDLSDEACAAAALNLDRCGVAARASVVRGDWAEAIDGVFDVVVSNPPYVRTEDIDGLDPEVRLHDPALALDGGADGLDSYRAIIAAAPKLLADGAPLVFEVGWDQAVSVADMLGASGFAIAQIGRDLGGHERVVAAVLSDAAQTGP